MQFTHGQRIHIIGVGGSGMSAIARVLLERGYNVSGSDRTTNALTDALAQDGATIYATHTAENVTGADMVIATSAVKVDHVEVVAATERGIPVYKRRDILAPLMAGQTVIGVAGTHGKTTTTSMIVHLLRECGLDPSYIVGGVMANTGTNAGVGSGDLFVIEADEYDDMFLGLQPDTIVLTSVEYDHPDFFESEAVMTGKFRAFLDLIQPGGTIIACVDYPLVHDLVADCRADVIGYSARHHEGAAMQAHNIRVEGEYTVFDYHIITGGRLGVNVGAVRVPLPGEHNAANAVAALTAVDRHGVLLPDALAALMTFKSTGRRFEVRGEAGGVIVVDDYAHHPTAVKLVCEAARVRYPDRAVWAVWQPHMYSRTQILMRDYVTAFEAADHVRVTDIYAAREAPIDGVDGAWAAASIQHADALHTGDIDATAAHLIETVQAPAVIIIMSAGDAPAIGVKFMEARR